MRLQYMLMSMPIAQLRGIAAALQIEDLSKNKDQAALIVEQTMVSDEGFNRLWKQLGADEKRLFAIVIFEMTSDGYTVGVAKSRLLHILESNYRNVGNCETALARFVALGLLGMTQIWYVGEGFELPDALAPLVYRAVSQMMPIQPIEESTVSAHTQSGNMLMHDLARLTSYIVRRSLPFTKTGTMYKRELPRVSPLMRSYGLIEGEGPQEWAGIPYSVYFTFYLLQRLGLLSIGPGAVAVHGISLQAFLQMSSEEIREQLQFCSEGVMVRGHRHLYGVLREWLACVPAGQWVPMTWAIANLLQIDLQEKVNWGASFLSFLQIMAFCGSIDLGNCGDMDVLRVPTRYRDEGEARWIVQPNLDVLVPEDAPVALHFLIGQLADLKQADAMSIYTLKKETILGLCDRGWKIDDFERALRRFSAAPVAQVVIRAIQDWVREYDKAVIWDVMLVRFQSDDAFREFSQHPKAQRLVIEAIADQAVIIKRSTEKEAREILREIGAPPPSDVRMPTGDVVTGMRSGKKPGIRTSKPDEAALNKLLSKDLIDFVGQTVPHTLS